MLGCSPPIQARFASERVSGETFPYATSRVQMPLVCDMQQKSAILDDWVLPNLVLYRKKIFRVLSEMIGVDTSPFLLKPTAPQVECVISTMSYLHIYQNLFK